MKQSNHYKENQKNSVQFKVENLLNNNYSLGVITACEKKCLNCDVSSTSVRHG